MDARQGALKVLIGAVALAPLLTAGPALRAQDTIDFAGFGFPYAAFDVLEHRELPVPGGVLRVAFGPGDTGLSHERLTDWIARSAEAVSIYYGRFPAPEARLLLLPVDSVGVRGGEAFGHRGPAIRITVGTGSTQAHLDRDWRMVHEMAHLALPMLAREHDWLAEGVAVYVESVARVQAGHRAAQEVWAEFVRDMPQGLPEAGDRGLDHTPTWGRIYWGGAIFCLLADVEIRRLSDNRVGLQDALRAVLAETGGHAQRREIAEVLAAADRATGLTVLADLYEEMRAAPVATDLDALWRRLGVRAAGDTVVFDEEAELAAIRRAIMAPPAPPPPAPPQAPG